jgi:flavocytochrome c
VALLKKWDKMTDVVVIGSGFAGLAAAIEAKNAGASVLILEKMKGYGGNSIISDGMIAGAGTPMQERAGIKDSPELMYRDMVEAGLGLNHPVLARTLVENSNQVVQWTIDYLGVTYKDRVDRLGGHSVARSYTTYNRSGSAIIKRLIAKVKELGIEVRKQMYLQKIIRDESGSVIGVAMRDGYDYPESQSGILKYIQAMRGVILATGGFANDIPFRSTQDPRLTEDIDSTNRVCTTSEALKEALRIGAFPIHLSWIQLGPWACPDEKGYGVGSDFSGYIVFPYGVIINPTTCRRFVNELADRKQRADAILKVGQPCIGIADSEGIEQSGYRIDHCVRKGVVKQFGTLAELAFTYNLSFETVKETIDRYNRAVDKQLDEEFRKPITPGSKPLVHPPYYAIRLWPKVHHTMGGVQINAEARVMGLSHRPIERLYAAGEVTGGVHGACRLGSCAITDCLVFGRIAGKNAAAEKS